MVKSDIAKVYCAFFRKLKRPSNNSHKRKWSNMLQLDLLYVDFWKWLTMGNC